MFAPEELLSLHDAARASLQGRCDVVRKDRVRQPNGSWRENTTVLASNVPCRKVPTGQTPTEQAIMQSTLGGHGVATFVIDAFVTVQRTDTIVYPSGSGKEYGVAGVLARTGGEYTRVVVYDDSIVAPAPAPAPTP
jgi:hypothetical protein